MPLVAVELPAQVICSVMGVPDDMRGQVVRWADEIFSRQRTEDGPERALAAIQNVMQYALELRDASRGATNDNMLGELAEAERAGVKITDGQFMQLFMSLLIAGFETTHTLIGQSLRMVLEDPDVAAQARAAQANGQIRELVEEFLRYITPAMHMARHATRDVELHGTRIRKGDMVLLWHVSANRDASVFDDPHRFDSLRKRNTHQSFGGGGPHFCIGNHLARLEVQILYRELLSRDLKITLNGRPERGWSVFIDQLLSLPVVCE
ncbi:cytochrome P450 [Actinomadura sp. LD22]|uniref:Cytochrome P450 n=1 Tax=Actinomadura physcomitrii TaxID=2650748 RepID=A0A6I4MB51_9ACTN|nr:cytochrome P450 [Actinomadura physcomitrii]MVZ99878.1 cytochrome P450 [Actinomadura physcomitrii]